MAAAAYTEPEQLPSVKLRGESSVGSSFSREGAKLEMEPEMLSAERMCRSVGEDERLRESARFQNIEKMRLKTEVKREADISWLFRASRFHNLGVWDLVNLGSLFFNKFINLYYI